MRRASRRSFRLILGSGGGVGATPCAEVSALRSACNSVSDAELLAGVAGGAKSALVELVARHLDLAFALAHLVTGDIDLAEAAVTEVFRFLWNGGRLDDHVGGSVRVSLLTTVRRHSLDVRGGR